MRYYGNTNTTGNICQYTKIQPIASPDPKGRSALGSGEHGVIWREFADTLI